MKAVGEYTCNKEETAELFNPFFFSIGENLREVIPSSDMDPLQYVHLQLGHIFNSIDNTGAAELQDIQYLLDTSIRRLVRGAAGVRELKISTRNFVSIFNSHCHLICVHVFCVWKI